MQNRSTFEMKTQPLAAINPINMKQLLSTKLNQFLEFPIKVLVPNDARYFTIPHYVTCDNILQNLTTDTENF